jgi:hypothetical protein
MQQSAKLEQSEITAYECPKCFRTLALQSAYAEHIREHYGVSLEFSPNLEKELTDKMKRRAEYFGHLNIRATNNVLETSKREAEYGGKFSRPLEREMGAVPEKKKRGSFARDLVLTALLLEV